MLECVSKVAFVEGSGGILEKSWTVRLILVEQSFKITSIPIKDLILAFFQSILINPDKAIPIAMKNLGMAIQKPFLPIANYLNLSRKNRVGTLAMPKIELPLSLVELSSGVIVIRAVSMPKIIFECTYVDVSVIVVEFALERSGVVEIGTFEALAAWEDQWKIGLHV